MRFERVVESVGALYLAALLLPLAYLVYFAAEGEGAPADYLGLLLRTVSLGLAVTASAFFLALPLALARVARDFGGARLLDLLGILPLAVPGYVMAYAWLAAGGSGGLFAAYFGTALPRPEGFLGAWWVLSLYTFPYFYLGLRSALERLDAGLLEAARTLGLGRGEVFLRVLWPLVWPGLALSALGVFLHVVADFGVVALMRYPTFSYAIYLALETAFDRAQAAGLSVALLVLTGALLFLEFRWVRRVAGRTAARPLRPELGRLRPLVWLYVGLLAGLALGVPLGVVLFWAGPELLRVDGSAFLSAWLGSVRTALPAAVLGAGLALALGLGERWGRGLGARAAFLGYAVPPMALALALVLFSLSGVPAIYGTALPLFWAYLVHYTAEGLGPIRAALASLSPRLEEAAMVLGEGGWGRFWRVLWPLLRNGVYAAGVLFFLAVVKDLPLTLMLAPLELETLAVALWGYLNEGLFAEAAPYALALVVLGALAALALLRLGGEIR